MWILARNRDSVKFDYVQIKQGLDKFVGADFKFLILISNIREILRDGMSFVHKGNIHTDKTNKNTVYNLVKKIKENSCITFDLDIKFV